MSVCHGVMLLCPLSSSARPHDCPRVARLDSQGIAPLDSDGDRGVDGVGEGVMGGEGEMVLACEAELVDELLGVLTKASGVCRLVQSGFDRETSTITVLPALADCNADPNTGAHLSTLSSPPISLPPPFPALPFLLLPLSSLSPPLSVHFSSLLVPLLLLSLLTSTLDHSGPNRDLGVGPKNQGGLVFRCVRE